MFSKSRRKNFECEYRERPALRSFPFSLVGIAVSLVDTSCRLVLVARRYEDDGISYCDIVSINFTYYGAVIRGGFCLYPASSSVARLRLHKIAN